MIKSRFNDYIRNILSEDEWLIIEDSYNESDNLEFETRFTLASGELGLRGTHFEGFIRNTLPANYMHGIFDKSEAFQRELCNLPNYNILKMYYKTRPITLSIGKITDYARILDIKKGILVKSYIHENEGRLTRVESISYLSRRVKRVAALRVMITPINYSGQIEFESLIDASVTNFIDYPRFRVKHFNVDEIGSFEGGGIFADVHTRDRKHRISVASKVSSNSDIASKQNKSHGEYGIEFFSIDAHENTMIIVDKFSTVQNNLSNIDTLKVADIILDEFASAGFEKGLEEHIYEYSKLWERAYIQIKGDEKLEKAIRFNIFHLMSTPNPNSSLTNIGAKMIHGEEYGGHAFWDTEIFILPYFINVFPEIAKNLVTYRYEMLEGAKENAKIRGFRGARYPWESADDGLEQCPDYTIEPDGTCYECTVAAQEIHVSADVIYGGYKYYTRTGDMEYFKKFLEIIAEVSRFFVSRLEYNKEFDRYELSNITGPDEWHEYISNNFYTNMIIKWCLKLSHKLLIETTSLTDFVKNKIDLKNIEIEEFSSVADKIYIKNMTGIIEQFEGYFNLIDVPIHDWDKNNMPIMPDEIKSLSRDKTTINKQADVVMAMYLFDDIFDMETQRVNFEYYEKRTLHRSSLSPSIFSLMGLRVGDGSHAYEYLCRSAYVDYDNNQGNTKEGMHAASAAGSYQALVYGFCGLRLEDGNIALAPKLPKHWEKVKFNVVIGDELHKITIEKENVSIEKCKK